MDACNIILLALAKELKKAAVNEAVGDIVRIATVIEHLSVSPLVHINDCEIRSRAYLGANEIDE